MAMKKIKRDDEVVVIAGKDKGKRGKVLKVLDDNRLLVSGVQMIKKHQKPNPQAGVHRNECCNQAGECRFPCLQKDQGLEHTAGC